MKTFSLLLRPLALVLALAVLGGCASLRMSWTEVSPQKFQELYDQRKFGDYWTYEGVRHGYACLVHFKIVNTNEVRKLEKVRCPMSELPAGFPKHPQKPITH